MHTQNSLYIKNMVCNRCIRVVKEEFEKIGVKIKKISLGEVITERPIKNLSINKIKLILEENGFELIEDKKAKAIERIKNFVIKIIYNKQLN